MKISIIIPIYNEERRILEFQQQFSKLNGEFEIIFVDGGSTDNSVKLIQENYKIFTSAKGRGNQLNEGIKNSTGEVLFFLHCDSLLPKDALEQIKEVMKEKYVGCFGINFDSPSILMKVCGYLSNRRVKDGNIAFGDQGIFISRYFFEMFIKEYKDIPIMEDFQFSLDINQVAGVQYGLTKSRIQTSARRYGNTMSTKLKTMYLMNKLRKDYLKGEDINVIVQKYKEVR